MIRPNGCLATLFLIPWIALRAAGARLLGGRAPDRRPAPGIPGPTTRAEPARRGPANSP